MQWLDTISEESCKLIFSLKDLRTAKGISQQQLADVLQISRTYYLAIENGQRRPSIDVVYTLALVYQTSMDFIYHAFYRQHYIWHFPDDSLQYAMRQARKIDIQYLKDRMQPAAPPKVPGAIVWQTGSAADGALSTEDDINFEGSATAL